MPPPLKSAITSLPAPGKTLGDEVEVEPVVAETADQCVGSHTSHQRVVTPTTVQRVVAAKARQHVGGAIAGNHIGLGVAGAVDRCGPRQSEVLQVCRQRVRNRRQDRIDTTCNFRGNVADIVHDVDIVAEATVHIVGAGAAIKRIVAAAAIQRVVAAKA